MTPTVLLVLAATLQQVPLVTLPQADSRGGEPFTNIFAVHELTDGRVLVTDNMDNAIRLVDFQTKSVRQLGRRGHGPGEYMAAHSIVPLRGDTVLIADNSQRRFVQVIDGEIAGTAPQPEAMLRSPDISAPVVDAARRLYFDVRNMEMRSDGFHERPGHLLRRQPGSERLDTVATLPARSRAPRANVGFNPFPYRSAWGLSRDGSVAIVTSEPYRVTWLRGDQEIVGPVIAHDPVPINDDEREAERRAFANRGRSKLEFAGATDASGRDRQLRQQIPDDVFPPTKPPFVVDRVLVSPTNDVWIPRASPWNAVHELIDVVGPDGNLRRQIRVPAGTRVVGFGRESLYVAIMDEFDLQWLGRVPLRRAQMRGLDIDHLPTGANR